MRRRLSSRTTILWSYVLPLLLVVGLSGALLMCWLGKIGGKDGEPLSVEGLCVFSVMWALVMVGLVRTLGFLKRVEVGVDALYISNYTTELRIPLAEVFAVYASGGSRGLTRVSIAFRNPSAFGQSIEFLPRLRQCWAGMDPAIRELQDLCEQARVRNGVDQATPSDATPSPLRRLRELNPWGLILGAFLIVCSMLFHWGRSFRLVHGGLEITPETHPRAYWSTILAVALVGLTIIAATLISFFRGLRRETSSESWLISLLALPLLSNTHAWFGRVVVGLLAVIASTCTIMIGSAILANHATLGEDFAVFGFLALIFATALGASIYAWWTFVMQFKRPK